MAPRITKKTICFVAGKSGGHIIPCLTLMQQQHAHDNVLFFTTNAALDMRIMAGAHQKKEALVHIPLPLHIQANNRCVRYVATAYNLISSFFISFSYLKKHKPAKVITTGGMVAVPVCYAAWLLGIPVDTYELNAVPGKANKLIARIATRICVMFDFTKNYFKNRTCVLTQYPVRYTQEDAFALSKHNARIALGLDPDTHTLLVLGGSQGSVQLNKILKTCIEQGLQNIQIIHQTGATDTTDWQALYKQHGIKALVFTFKENLAPCIAACDIALCRAGAGTLFELVFFNKPAIIVPLHGLGDNHQVANAQALAQMYPALYTVVHQWHRKRIERIRNILNSVNKI